MAEYYLRSNLKLEPLWNQWYAWPLLIQPATAACISAKSHTMIMRSYLKAPHLHKAAVKNPMMRGGPFMDYSGGIEKVSELLTHTEEKLAELLGLAADIDALNTQLAGYSGMSLEEVYPLMPERLKGLVEVGYDLNHHASIRFIEPLLYHSDFYQPQLQSISLALVEDDERPFVLSTPRLKGGDDLHLDLGFNDPLIDQLFAMKDQPGDLSIIDTLVERCGLNTEQRAQLHSFFTTEPPQPAVAEPLQAGEVRVRYFGHATVLLECEGMAILTDPVIGYRFKDCSTRYGYEDLPEKIDYVVLTHNHQDHVMFESLLQIRHKVGTVVVPANSGGFLQDPSLKYILQAIGFPRVVTLDELEKLEIPQGFIQGLPFFGEHGDLHIHSKLAFLFELQGQRVLCAADSNNLSQAMYEAIHRMTGDIDTIFIGMECEGAPMSWLYGALFSSTVNRAQDQSRRLNGSNSDKASAIVSLFNPRQVYIYAMGMEPWLGFISSIKYTPDSLPIVESNKLIEYCREREIQAKRLNGCAVVGL